jgi:hypothetical protein
MIYEYNIVQAVRVQTTKLSPGQASASTQVCEDIEHPDRQHGDFGYRGAVYFLLSIENGRDNQFSDWDHPPST